MSGFSERLKAARQQLDLTQEQLADELHVTKASISAWENDREAPRFSLLPRLRLVLGTSLDALLCGVDEGKASTPAEHAISTRTDAEVRLLKAYRKLPAKRRKALLEMLD